MSRISKFPDVFLVSGTNNYVVFIALLLSGLVVGVSAVFFPLYFVIVATASTLGVLLCAGVFFRPYSVLLFLVVFMPFEEFVLRLIPGPPVLRFASGFVGEIIIYFTAIVVLISKVTQGRYLRRTPIDIPLIVFLGFALVSLLLNGSPIFGSLVNLRTMLRYIVLYYVVVNLELKPEQIRRLLTTVLAIGILQVVVGAAQFLTNGSINEYFLPAPTAIEVGGISRQYILVERGREIGSIFGTLGDTIFFALFMLIVFVTFLGRMHTYKFHHLLFVGLLFLAANLAYARAVVFAMLLLLIIFYWVRYGINRTFLLAMLVLPWLIGGVFAMVNSSFVRQEYRNPGFRETSILENITGVFTLEYVQHAQAQRLGALLGIPATVLANEPLLGYGPDEITTIQRLNESNPSYLFRTLRVEGFEDVYWTALLAYFGILGTSAFAAILFALFRTARHVLKFARDSVSHELAITVNCLVVIVPFLLFFYRVLEFRIFSFYFWLYSGLMIAAYLENSVVSKPNISPVSNSISY